MTQHYKDNQNNIYGFKPDGIEVTAITMVEVNQINAEKARPKTPEELNAIRIQELKQLLSESDYKFSADYDKQGTPEWEQLKLDRKAWRDEIRSLEV